MSTVEYNWQTTRHEKCASCRDDCDVLNIVAHHVKNKVIKLDFVRFGETTCRHFHAILKSIILCHIVLLKTT